MALQKLAVLAALLAFGAAAASAHAVHDHGRTLAQKDDDSKENNGLHLGKIRCGRRARAWCRQKLL
jgi:hypothetical protein